MEQIPACYIGLINFLEQEYGDLKAYHEFTIRWKLDNGQVMTGIIDMLVETEHEYIIVD